jgi:hypothetical protein
MFRAFVRLASPLRNDHFLRTGTLLLGILLPTSLLTLSAIAVPLKNGGSVFNRAPSLIETSTSTKIPGVPATYKFTISVPEDAGEPLQAVTITPRENVESLRFDENESRAFAGGSALHLASIGGDQPSNSKEVTVVFDPPVSPGSTVTVSLKAKNNPEFGGVYLFGITAFSAGENSPGLFLGNGTLHFYANSR